MVVLLGVLIATLLILYFAFITNEKVGYFFFAFAFIFPPIFLPFFVPGSNGVSSGGSPLFNIAMILCQGACLIVALFSIQTQEFNSSPEEILNGYAQKVAIFIGVILFVLQMITSLTESKNIISIVNLFLYLLGIVIMRKMSYEKLCNATLNVFVFLALVIFMGILFRINWGGRDLSVLNISEGVYFSPFKSYFNLPERVAGPMRSPQELAIFCVAGVALSVFNKSNSTSRTLVSSFFFSILGSLSGSRTFYITLFVIVCLKILSRLTIQQNGSFLPYAGIGFLTIYFVTVKVFLPLVSDSRNVNEIGGRTYLWDTILKHWDDNGLLGHGPNTLKAYMHTQLGVLPYGHAHNTFLQYLWDFGIIGALSYILFVICWVVIMDSRRRGGLNPLCMFLAFQTIQSERFFLIELSYKGICTLLMFLFLVENTSTRGAHAESVTGKNLFRNIFEK